MGDIVRVPIVRVKGVRVATGQKGLPGQSAYELAVANGFEGTLEEWLESLAGTDGQDGEDGDDGAPGASAYEVAVAEGFVGDEAAWLASLQGGDGSDGDDGEDGQNGESPLLRVDSGFIQWKLPSDVAWTNLIAVSAITGSDGEDGVDGDDGREVQLQSNGTHIQWRYVGDVSWTDLVALDDLKGADGDAGPGVPTGGTTGQVLAKASNDDYDTEWIDPPEGGGGGAAPEVRHSNDDTYDYTGTAPNGTAEGSSGWTVTRITLTSPPVVMTGTGTWTGRAAISYS